MTRRPFKMVQAVCSAVLIVGAAMAAVPQPEPETMELWNSKWKVTGVLTQVQDSILARPVQEFLQNKNLPLVMESCDLWTNNYAVEAIVRFHQAGAVKTAQASLNCGMGVMDGITNTPYTLAIRPVVAGALRCSVQYGSLNPAARQKHGAVAGNWSLASIGPRFTPDDISPVMDDDFRLRLENDFGGLSVSGTWHTMRFEARGAEARFYFDGILSGCESNRLTRPGAIQLRLTAPALVGGFSIMPLAQDDAHWQPAPLDGICNAAGFVDAASFNPDSCGILRVEGVPFQLAKSPCGMDHVDVGMSRFRFNLCRGQASASSTFPPPNMKDPAQLTLNIPHGVYRRAWVLAASDSEPNSAPELTIRFYKPTAGWPLDANRGIPEWTAATKSADAHRVAVRMADGKDGSLWALPIDLDAGALAGDYRDVGLMSVELTKQTHDFVAFPDPCNYGSFPGGLPSAARVFALTFEKAPVAAYAAGKRRGNLYPYPEKAVWNVELASQSEQPVDVQIDIHSAGPLGSICSQTQSVTLLPGAQKQVSFEPKTQEAGLYKLQTTVACGDWKQIREGAFLMLPSDKDRKATAITSRWGLWNWFGAHGTETDPVENMRQMRALGSLKGARLSVSNAAPSGATASPVESRAGWGLGPTHDRIVSRGLPDWASTNPEDQPAQAAFAANVAARAAEMQALHPDLMYFNAFAEDSISMRLTHGLPSYAFGQPWFDYTDQEKKRVRGYLAVAKATAEGVRKGAPKAKFIFGHCSPNFFLPFFREPDWDPAPYDGFGLDMPQFERMPERPARATEPNSLYFLFKEMKDRGMKKELVHLESYFPSSHPLALGHRLQADSVVRTAVLSMSMGSTGFFDCWSLHDCAAAWGSQHYGCVGLIGRAPEYNPKPAAAAYATMARVLDLAEYDGYLDTGSRSAYAVRFKDPDAKRLIYACWTIRGARPLALELDPGATASVIDENGNETELKPENGMCRITLLPTPVWVVTRAGALAKVSVGAPVNQQAPSSHTILLDDFEKNDWTYSPEPYTPFASNHWDVVRTPARMTSERIVSTERESTVWRIAMPVSQEGKPFVGFYGVFTPPRPIPIPGKARALGLMGKGKSAWNRVVFEIEDAKGELFLSAGTKDAWNCDDTHSWSYFNFDGWRYMEFPLPGNLPADNYREKHNVWWNSSEEGVVDLPVQLTKIIVETRTHQIYMNDLLPIFDSSVEIDDIIAVYDDNESATETPITLQHAAAGLAAPPMSTGQGLPNKIAELAANGMAPAPEIESLFPPETQHDGTRVHVKIKPVENVKQYKVWVSVYSDGRGARAMVSGENPELLVKGLKPAMKFFLFATVIGLDGKESQPSKARETVLQDEFPMK